MKLVVYVVRPASGYQCDFDIKGFTYKKDADDYCEYQNNKKRSDGQAEDDYGYADGLTEGDYGYDDRQAEGFEVVAIEVL